MKLKPIVIHIFHALQEFAAQYQYEQSLKCQARIAANTEALKKGAIIIDESSSITQEQIDFLAKKASA